MKHKFWSCNPNDVTKTVIKLSLLEFLTSKLANIYY